MSTIMLVCNAGMSTSMLVTKMQKASAAQGRQDTIFAVPVSEVPNEVAEKAIDVILIGPQVKFVLGEFKEKYEPAIKVSDINMMDYGTMNGENVFRAAVALMEA